MGVGGFSIYRPVHSIFTLEKGIRTRNLKQVDRPLLYTYRNYLSPDCPKPIVSTVATPFVVSLSNLVKPINRLLCNIPVDQYH